MCSKQIHVSDKFLMKRKLQIQIDVTVFIKSLSSENTQSILFLEIKSIFLFLFSVFVNIYETSTSYLRASSKRNEW